MTGRAEARPLHPAEALLAVAIAFLLLPTAGARLQITLGLPGLVATEILLVLGPALLVIAVVRAQPVTAFGLDPPRLRTLAGAVLASVAAFYFVAGGIELLQERVVPLPSDVRRQLQQMLVPAEGPRPLAVDLVVFALVPALCEELLFRGVLLRSLLPLGAPLALLSSSLAFGAFHFSPWKLLPTAALGAVLGAITLRARSVVPSIAGHALNNTLVILLVRAGHEDAPAAGTRVGAALLVLSLPILVLGMRLVSPRNVSH